MVRISRPRLPELDQPAPGVGCVELRAERPDARAVGAADVSSGRWPSSRAPSLRRMESEAVKSLAIGKARHAGDRDGVEAGRPDRRRSPRRPEPAPGSGGRRRSRGVGAAPAEASSACSIAPTKNVSARGEASAASTAASTCSRPSAGGPTRSAPRYGSPARGSEPAPSRPRRPSSEGGRYLGAMRTEALEPWAGRRDTVRAQRQSASPWRP